MSFMNYRRAGRASSNYPIYLCICDQSRDTQWSVRSYRWHSVGTWIINRSLYNALVMIKANFVPATAGNIAETTVFGHPAERLCCKRCREISSEDAIPRSLSALRSCLHRQFSKFIKIGRKPAFDFHQLKLRGPVWPTTVGAKRLEWDR